jgi:hypothetical protein
MMIVMMRMIVMMIVMMMIVMINSNPSSPVKVTDGCRHVGVLHVSLEVVELVNIKTYMVTMMIVMMTMMKTMMVTMIMMQRSG